MMTTAAFVSLIPYPLNWVLGSLVQFYVIVIIVWAVLSWINKGTGLISDIYNVLDRIVSPYVNLFRRFIPSAGGMDFSPLIAIILLQVVARLVL
ncbi:MAG: YggT family protein [Coriobacteriales bacterium]|jgi:YggT family protein|nr:YggT family protein [Coriobacteriales bacterium]